MKLHIYSYRYAQEILQHSNNIAAWTEIESILGAAPVFEHPNKSEKTKELRVVQQLMNTYFDRRFAVDHQWEYHPRATGISNSELAADYRKSFGNLTIQAEIQFGNMARWYSDIFKLQAAYAQARIRCGLCVLPVKKMARAIDSNVAHYERAIRELPAAELSITLPILLIGLEQDDQTEVVNVQTCQFNGVKELTGRGKTENRWRIVNGYIAGAPMNSIGPLSDPGPMPAGAVDEADQDQ